MGAQRRRLPPPISHAFSASRSWSPRQVQTRRTWLRRRWSARWRTSIASIRPGALAAPGQWHLPPGGRPLPGSARPGPCHPVAARGGAPTPPTRAPRPRARLSRHAWGEDGHADDGRGRVKSNTHHRARRAVGSPARRLPEPMLGGAPPGHRQCSRTRTLEPDKLARMRAAGMATTPETNCPQPARQVVRDHVQASQAALAPSLPLGKCLGAGPYLRSRITFSTTACWRWSVNKVFDGLNRPQPAARLEARNMPPDSSANLTSALASRRPGGHCSSAPLACSGACVSQSRHRRIGPPSP
jgi:hypothetical protein